MNPVTGSFDPRIPGEQNEIAFTAASARGFDLERDSVALLFVRFEGSNAYASELAFSRGRGNLFVRGVCGNVGSEVQVSEAVFPFNYLFRGGDSPTCEIACDADASGAVKLTDGVLLLNFLFVGGAAPAGWVDRLPVCEDALPDHCAQPNPSCEGPGPI